MGAALARGLVASGTLPAENVSGYDPARGRAESLRAEIGISLAHGNREGAERAEVVILAVKPNLVSGVVREMAHVLSPGKLLISIAAGVPLEVLERLAGAGVPIVRAMPNTPAQVRNG